ncbi:MAG: phosphotransferase [Patescibacteria group bacterium]
MSETHPIPEVKRVESEQEKAERHARELADFFQEMQEHGLAPEAMYQHGKTYAANENGTVGTLDRPFGVFRVAEEHQRVVGSKERAIYKTQMESKTGAGIDREVAFYQKFLPQVQAALSPEVREGLAFPKLLKVFEKEGKAKAILLSELQGDLLGVHDFGYEGKATTADFQRIIELVRAVQKISPAELQAASPSTKSIDHANSEAEWLSQDKVDLIGKQLGEGYDTKSLQVITEAEKSIRQQPERVLSEDVFQTNLMVLPDGRTASFDWERLEIGTNPGHDYAKFASRMWTEPEKQREFIRMTLAANQDTPGFKAMFKSNLLATEYSHLFRHYAGIVERAEADPSRYANRPQLLAEAEQAAPALKQAIAELLDDTGPWAEEKLPE